MAFLPGRLRYTLSVSRGWLNHAIVSWSGSTFVRASCTQLPVVERKPLFLKASQFQHLFEEGPTEKVYANTFVSGLSHAQQGKWLEEWARKVLREKNPKADIVDPEPEKCHNGWRRGCNNTSYDFLLGARRVEIKSSRLAHSSAQGGRWTVEFGSVKLPYGERTKPAFDDLYLVILSPAGLHLIKHDLATAVSTRGNLTEMSGHVIKAYGRSGTDSWEDALGQILEKLCERGGCSVVDKKVFSELDFKEIVSRRVSPGEAAAAAMLMCGMSREKRGNRIQEVGLAIDRVLHPLSDFSFAEGNRGKANAPADWVRGNQRVELKSCALTFNPTQCRWQCRFSGIKPGLFDELWLAVYSSVGIRYYRSKSCERLGLCNAGAVTKILGHGLYFLGPGGELDQFEAFKAIETKMALRGCELIAVIEWEKGGAMRG